MRVLHIYKTYLPESFTGVERVIHALSEGTAALGVENHVLSLGARASTAPVRIGEHWAHTARQELFVASTGLSLSVFSRFAAAAREADLVHYHFPWPMMDLLQAMVAPDRPSLVTYHSDIVRQKRLLKLYAPLMHRFLGNAGAIVATSPNYLETSAVLQRYRDKTVVIPIGIPDEAPPPERDVARWREVVGEGFFLFVGALRYYKGLTTLMDAARASGLKVVVVGSGELGAEVERSAIANVMLLGQISDSDKAALLSLCTAFVFPSNLRSEAFGVALLEASRAGKPMISCEIGTGTSFVNIDQKTGLVVPPGDAAALRQAMQSLSANPEMAETMGRNARLRYETVFTARRMASAYHAVYTQLTGEAEPIDERALATP